ncbi:hypothetical protein ACTHQY_08995 [Rhodococcoides corynebacterioides]
MNNAVCRITDEFEDDCPHCARKRQAELDRLHQIATNPLHEEQP